MAIELDAESAAMVDSLVAQGYFDSADEVVREALATLTREIARAKLEQLIDEELGQADAGEVVVVGGDDLAWLRDQKAYTRKLKAEGRIPDPHV